MAATKGGMELEEVTLPDSREDPGPQYYSRGYRRLPQTARSPGSHPVLHDQYPGIPPIYNPAPQSFSSPPQQMSSSNNNTNVVVVNQPSAPQVVETVVVEDPPKDNLVPTLCVMVLCCVSCNWLGLVCLIPALILAICASSANNAGDYETARNYARVSLCCDIFVVLQYVVTVIIGIVTVSVFFTVGLGFIGIEAKGHL